MHLLAPLAALLGIEVEAITDRVRNTIIVNAVMLVLALVGVSFLVAAGFFALVLAAVVRPFAEIVPEAYHLLLAISGGCWIVAFGLFLAVYARILTTPSLTR